MKIWKLLGFAVLVTAVRRPCSRRHGVAAGQSKESVTLVWWHNATQGEGLKLWTSVASEFHKLHPDVTVKAVPLQNEQFKTKIPIALQSTARQTSSRTGVAASWSTRSRRARSPT